jgi:hypothetical protein
VSAENINYAWRLAVEIVEPAGQVAGFVEIAQALIEALEQLIALGEVVEEIY